MVDQLPTVGGDSGPREVTPVMIFGGDGVPVESAASGGSVSTGNSDQTPLLAAATFTGDWEVNSFEHVLINVLADAAGTLFVDFAIVKDGVDSTGPITDADVVMTLAAPVDVYADVPYFRALVKGAGRAFRVRYVNGAVDQTSFALISSYGTNIFPPSTSADNELLVTTKESQRGLFFAVGAQDVSATEYRLAVDLNDVLNFPHSNVGRIVFTAVFLTVDKENTAQGLVRIGIVTRIDDTDADIAFIQGVGFEKSGNTSIVRDRIFSPNRIDCKVEGGSLINVATDFKITGVTAVNNLTSLPCFKGGDRPAEVGDAIIEFQHSSGGSFNPSISGFYFTERD